MTRDEIIEASRKGLEKSLQPSIRMTKKHHPHNRYERKLIEEKIKLNDSLKGRTGQVRRKLREAEEVQELEHELKE